MNSHEWKTRLTQKDGFGVSCAVAVGFGFSVFWLNAWMDFENLTTIVNDVETKLPVTISPLPLETSYF